MRVKVSKTELLRQVPDSIRRDWTAIFGIPDYFEFQVASTVEDYVGLKEVRNMETEYPKEYDLFTATEWYIFCCLIQNPTGATIQSLSKPLRTNDNSSNLVSVHVKLMRKKIEKHDLPYRIFAKRGFGVYIIQKLV